MASREGQVAALLMADATFPLLVPGGIYTDEVIGVEGFRRGTIDPLDVENYSPTALAFDDKGYLVTCCVVREQQTNMFGNVIDIKEKLMATSQMVYIYFYERRGHSDIDVAKLRSHIVLQGERLSNPGSYELMWAHETAHMYDVGPVKNATTLCQHWQCVSIRKP